MQGYSSSIPGTVIVVGALHYAGRYVEGFNVIVSRSEIGKGGSDI